MSDAPQDIAVLRLDNIGDAILTTGFLDALRRVWPYARIEVWCTEATAHVFSRCPSVNAVLALPVISPRYVSRSEAMAHLECFKQRAAGRFDVVINPRCAPDAYGAAVYAGASEAPLRVAFRQTEFVDGLNPNAAYTLLVDPPFPREHAAFVGRHVLNALGLGDELAGPRLTFSRRASRKAAAITSAAPYVAVGIGASLPYKIWPAANFALICDALAHREYRIVLVGSDRERAIAAAITARVSSPIVDLVGETTLEETAAIVAGAALFIGNDSAPKHLAAIVGTPVVEIGWLGVDTPGFGYDRDFDALAAKYEKIAPPIGFTTEQTLAGLAVASISPDRVLAAINRMLRPSD
jgi:heptosyltransferase-2